MAFMATPVPTEFFHRYRFMAAVQTDKGMKSWGMSKVEQDPFSLDVFLWRGIEADKPLMADEISPRGELLVFLYNRDHKGGKRLNFRYEGGRKVPLWLDATKSEVAMECVILTDVSYGRSQDVDYDDLPPVIRV